MPIIEIDVWIWPLTMLPGDVASREQLLSIDERSRATRFLADADRVSYIAGRSRMRQILGGYTDQNPGDLRFAYGAAGKPTLVADRPVPHFNLSHSDGLAALAVSAQHPVGIDIESVRPIHEDIAERFFSETEARAIAALPPIERTAAFFRCWTRKEAFVKAVGDGLNYPLASFDVPITAEAVTVIASIAGANSAEAALWRLVSLEPKSGFTGAVAVKTHCAEDVVNVHLRT